MIRLFLILFGCFLFLSGCTYKKGDSYRSDIAGDTLHYIIFAKGSGIKLIEKASQIKEYHESRGNICQVRYITDSVALGKGKAILLSRSVLPDIKDDMLSKGYFGTFTTRQEVTIMIVARDQIENYFNKVR